jgi:predicted nucleic acid-binding protein
MDSEILDCWFQALIQSNGGARHPRTAEESLLIVDDRLARRFALKQGINIVGTVRLLDLAERRGLIKSAELSITEMTAIGYRVSTQQ